MKIKVTFIDNKKSLCMQQLKEIYGILKSVYDSNNSLLDVSDIVNDIFECKFTDSENTIIFSYSHLTIDENEKEIQNKIKPLIENNKAKNLFIIDLCLDHADCSPTGVYLAEKLKKYGTIIYTSGNQNYWRKNKATSQENYWIIPRAVHSTNQGEDTMVHHWTAYNVSPFYEELFKRYNKNIDNGSVSKSYYELLDNLLSSVYQNEQYYGSILFKCQLIFEFANDD